jgi:hypothetical protein
MMKIEKVLYKAQAKATGGRDGRAVSSHGVLDVMMGLHQLTETRLFASRQAREQGALSGGAESSR